MPYGFPSGRQLLREIVGLLKAGVEYARRGQKKGKSIDYRFDALAENCSLGELGEFANTLDRSFQPSVDFFVEHRPEFMNIGKMAIAAFLTPYEDDKSLLVRKKDKNWYEHLYENISATPDEFANSGVSIVTFNYDRSLERFLYVALKNSHGLDDEETAELLAALPIVHVHGELEPLTGSAARRRQSYNQEVNASVVAERVQHISIMPEDIDDSPRFKEARSLIDEAERICFLGFGYADQNIKRLKITQAAKNTAIFGSAYDIQPAERHRVKELFAPITRRPHLGDPQQTNLQFLRQRIRLR